MSQSKRTSKGRRAVSVIGVAGISLALADGGASAAISGSATDIQSPNGARQLMPFGEEELSDVSLSTFYLFDKENARSAQSGVQVAFGGCGHGCGGHGCGGCGGRGCGGCGGRGCGGHGCGFGGCRGCGFGGCGGCGFGGWWGGGCGCCLSWGACRWC